MLMSLKIPASVPRAQVTKSTDTLAKGDPCPCRGSTALQCSTLLLLDIVYAGIHVQATELVSDL